MTKIGALIFDLDGTLADSHDDIARGLELAFADIDHDMSGRCRELVDGSSLETIYRRVFEPNAPNRLDAFVDAYRQHYDRLLTHSTRPFPGVEDTLARLTARGSRPRLGVATSKRTVTARLLVERLGLAHYFDYVVGSGGLFPEKPAPDLLLHAAAELDVSPSSTVMIGDTTRDIVAGQRAGMRTVAVTWGVGERTELAAASPDHMLDEFAAIEQLGIF